jgi:hypothetical protein
MPATDETIRQDVSTEPLSGRSQPRMALDSHHAARFGRSSPVLAHWLAHSEGFRVRSRRGGGVVLRVHGLPGRPQTIVVRTSLGGRRLLVPAEAFDEVVPDERLLTVGTSLRSAARGDRGPRMAGRVVRVSARSGRAASSSLARASRRLATTSYKVVVERGWPRASRGLRAAGLAAARLGRSAGAWGRVYGARGARTGGRLLWRFVLLLAGMVRDAGLTLVELARDLLPRLGGGLVRGANHARAAANFVARRASRAGALLSGQAREALRRRSSKAEEPPLLAERYPD